MTSERLPQARERLGLAHRVVVAGGVLDGVVVGRDGADPGRERRPVQEEALVSVPLGRSRQVEGEMPRRRIRRRRRIGDAAKRGGGGVTTSARRRRRLARPSLLVVARLMKLPCPRISALSGAVWSARTLTLNQGIDSFNC